MLILSETDVRRCLDMRACLAANREALIAVASGDALVPSRLALPYHRAAAVGVAAAAVASDTAMAAPAEDWSLFKPASLQQQKETLKMGVKVVSIRATNPAHGYPLVPATVLHMDPVTGTVDAVLAATYLTGARTAAGSAIAVQHYFKHQQPHNNDNTMKRLQHVVIFGAGLQAEQHVHAIRTAMENDEYSAAVANVTIPVVTIINRTAPRAEQLQANLLRTGGLVDACHVVELCDTAAVAKALQTANVIVTCTNAVVPLWDDHAAEFLSPDSCCIIVGIGSYTPNMQEVPIATVNRCRHVWIDTPEAVTVGDLKHLQQPHPNDATPTTTTARTQLIGTVLQNKDDACACSGLVFYKAVGTAIQDVLTADAVVQKARELKIGTEIDMS